MSRKVLGIDIRNHSLSAVLLNSSLRQYRVDDFVHLPLAAPPEPERSLSWALQTLTEKIDITGSDCVVSIPANQFAFRNLQIEGQRVDDAPPLVDERPPYKIISRGEVAGPCQLARAAGHQGWYCAMNALFGRFWKFRVDYSVMPWAVFTDPEIARVGLNEQEAAEQGRICEVTRYGIDDLDRAIADGTDTGFVKVLTQPGSDKILGVSIVGPHAGDLIAEYVMAMKNNLGLKKLYLNFEIAYWANCVYPKPLNKKIKNKKDPLFIEEIGRAHV